jgi:hypothetical protein
MLFLIDVMAYAVSLVNPLKPWLFLSFYYSGLPFVVRHPTPVIDIRLLLDVRPYFWDITWGYVLVIRRLDSREH